VNRFFTWALLFPDKRKNRGQSETKRQNGGQGERHPEGEGKHEKNEEEKAGWQMQYKSGIGKKARDGNLNRE
jgi:hypothetical protein